MSRREDGYCGLYCGSCPLFIKTKEGMINDFAAEIGLPVEDVACSGCKSEQVAKWCRTCNLKDCSKEKGFETCIECSDYLCEDLKAFKDDVEYPYHIEIEENLKQINEEGMEVWLASMKKRWSCDNCGQPHNWYQQECSNCDSKVDGYEKPQD